jgi:RNA polymerase sigma-70 factor, ECF subfamily
MNSAAAGNRAASVRPLPAVAHQGPSLERVPNDQSRTTELPHDIATRIRAGDERALELLFRACYASLCEFAVRYVREDALAEELVQDLFADLWARRREWQPGGPARAYLFGAVRNRALNLRKRQATERDWEQDESVTEIRVLHREPARVDELVERDELRARVNAAVESLPERCRLVMHLRWREQMPHADIANVMGISVKGVEIQLSRGLKALRALFGSDGPRRLG